MHPCLPPSSVYMLLLLSDACSFLPGPWSPCSATCGEGWQHREVHCRVYLEGTKARARIDDRECPGPKPPDKQTCSGPPCVR